MLDGSNCSGSFPDVVTEMKARIERIERAILVQPQATH